MNKKDIYPRSPKAQKTGLNGMSTTDAYLIEFIRDTQRNPHQLMDSYRNFLMREKLDVSKAKLLKIIDQGLEKNLLKYARDAYPWLIIPTKKGLQFAKIPYEKEVQP